MHLFRVNAVGPALVAKHFLLLLPRRGSAVLAAVLARVGSIADNRLSGWYGYRATKAALNQLIRMAFIELVRTRPDALCVAPHPGTVDTALSGPFRVGVPHGRLFTSDQAAVHPLRVPDALAPADSGGFSPGTAGACRTDVDGGGREEMHRRVGVDRFAGPPPVSAHPPDRRRSGSYTAVMPGGVKRRGSI
ncbi:hypothetical protein [Azospirillum halopraeferens]|uniref:hypothetical protein n=1 Tax=Azospirillum halopraeferens TaxID=34010 RepID=UPI000402DEDD|nr:hypothetical protein [Azospirillum halopraeferens]